MIPLTHNATILSETAGRRVLDIRGKWVNWLDDRRWKPIDCSFVEVGQSWESRSGPFAIALPKQANRPIEIVSTNKWNVFQKTRISDADFSMRITPLDVAPVVSVIESPTTVAFPGAYPFGDLVYCLNHGRAPRFQKLVRINSIPQGTGPLRISFRMTHDAAQARTNDRPLDIAGLDTQRQMAIDVKNELGRDGRIQDIMRKQFLLAEGLKRQWDGSQRNLTASLELRAAGSTGLRGLGIKPAFAWDSSPEPKRIPITLEIARQPDGSVLLTKVVPRAFLLAAVLPLYVDSTAAFYPNPNVEVTSVDGQATHTSNNLPWTTVLISNGTSGTDTGTSWKHCSFAGTTLWAMCFRAIVLFDSSALDDAATINSATLSANGSSQLDISGPNTPSSNFYGSAPASNTAVAAGDYLQTQNTAFCDTAIGYSSWVTGSYMEFAMNSAGLAAISKTGVSKFSFKNTEYDVAATDPTRGSSSTQYAVVAKSAETSGTTSDPKLVVDYTVGGSGPSAAQRVIAVAT